MNWFPLLEMFKKGGSIHPLIRPGKGDSVPAQVGWSVTYIEDNHILHKGPYTIDLEDGDFDIYSAWQGTEELGEGSLDECKTICENHALLQRHIRIELNERDRDRLSAVAKRRNMPVEDTAVGLIQQSLRLWEKNT